MLDRDALRKTAAKIEAAAIKRRKKHGPIESGETIVAAAIKYKGLVCVVERPGRHPDVFRQLDALGWTEGRHTHDQGFITSEGRFVGRDEARKIAEAADQIIASRVDAEGVPYKFNHPHLFSEDVW